MISLKFYLEASLTTPVDGSMVIQDIINDGNNPERQIYLGSTEADRSFDNYASPGDPIQVFISGGGGPFVPNNFILAASQADLDVNNPGDTLDIDSPILSGSANAVPVWIRFVGDPQDPALRDDLLLQTNELIEESTA